MYKHLWRNFVHSHKPTHTHHSGYWRSEDRHRRCHSKHFPRGRDIHHLNISVRLRMRYHIAHSSSHSGMYPHMSLSRVFYRRYIGIDLPGKPVLLNMRCYIVRNVHRLFGYSHMIRYKRPVLKGRGRRHFDSFGLGHIWRYMHHNGWCC